MQEDIDAADDLADAVRAQLAEQLRASENYNNSELRRLMIAQHHLAMLAASGMIPEFAAARGYETITDKRRLADLKITAAGRNVPGLLVPQLRDDGSTWGYQYRPDSPR